MQMEKHIENKIVKGWNQMINDFTPKLNPATLVVDSTIDQDRTHLHDAVENIEDVRTSQRERMSRIYADTFQHIPQIGSRCRTTAIDLIIHRQTGQIIIIFKNYKHWANRIRLIILLFKRSQNIRHWKKCFILEYIE